jgi:hypothetical protein
VKRAALPLAALAAAATVGLAQQTATTEPRTSTTPQKQTAPAADSSPRMSETDKLILLGDCMTQMQAAHPSVPEKDAKAYCDKRVKSYSFPHN